MIKKVKIANLVPGAYIHDYNFSLDDEGIFIEPGPVKDESIITTLSSWGISEVYIDTEKGVDVKEPQKKPQKVTSRKQVSDKINFKGWGVTRTNYVPLFSEIKTAKNILRNAISFIDNTVRKFNTGDVPDVKNAYTVVDQVKKSIIRNRDALILLTRMRTKDEYTLYHSISVSTLALGLCGYSGLSEAESQDIAVGALFHDIGKTVIPDAILNKPGKLTDNEFNKIKKHAENSVDLLKNVKGLPVESLDIAKHHHEKFDGSGYPHGLSGNEIQYGTHLVSICDVFDALTSARCYKNKIDTVSALQIMYDMAGQHFCTEYLYNFIRFIGVYPVGTHVVTDDNKIAVVTSSTDDMLRPVITVLYDEGKKQKVKPYEVNLKEANRSIKNYTSSFQVNELP